MKRNLLLCLMLAAAMTIGLNSCSSDPAPAKEIAKEYTGANLVVKSEGVAVADASVKIEAKTNNQVELTLANIVNGNPLFKMDAEAVQTKAEYSFTGEKTVDGMKVSVKGAVIDGKANVNVGIEILSSEILKSWTYNCVTDEYDNKTYDPLVFDIKMKASYDSAKTADLKELLGFLVPVVNEMVLPSMFPNLQFIFAKNGFVSIKVIDASSGTPKEVDLPNLARYTYNSTKKQLVFDAPIGGLMPTTGKAAQELPAIIQIPFDCTFKDGVMTATVDNTLLMTLVQLIPSGESLQALLAQLDKLVPPNFQGYLPLIKGLVTAVVEAVQSPDLEKFTVGGRLMPYVAPPAQ